MLHGTSYVQTDKVVRNEICEYTSTESVSSQTNKGLFTEKQKEQSKELTIKHLNKGNITKFHEQLSNTNGCFSLRNNFSSGSRRSKCVLYGALLKLNLGKQEEVSQN